jgi:hypothetical protein
MDMNVLEKTIELQELQEDQEFQEDQEDQEDLNTVDDTTEKKEKVYSTHTKFCTFGKNCKKKFKCVFAHNFKELCPIICKYDKECLRGDKCYYMHTSETKVQYVKRAFKDDIVKFNIKLVDDKRKNKVVKDLKQVKEEIIENPPEYYEDMKRIHKNLRAMYYDPIFEYMSWADINETVDLDCYEEKYKKVLYTL